MSLIFRYKRVLRPDGTTVKIPCAPITLTKGEESFDAIALLDSGADISVMPQSVAEILGLALNGKIEPLFGLGGKSKCVQAAVEILIAKGHEKYILDNVPFKIVLDEYEFPIILGRYGFFDEFTITFDEINEKVSLKRIGERSKIKEMKY